MRNTINTRLSLAIVASLAGVPALAADVLIPNLTAAGAAARADVIPETQTGTGTTAVAQTAGAIADTANMSNITTGVLAVARGGTGTTTTTGTGNVVFATSPTFTTATNTGVFATGTVAVSGNAAPVSGVYRVSGTTLDFSSNTTRAGGFSSTQLFDVVGQISAPNLTQSSAAQTGTLCWTTGGAFSVDTTVGCLASSARFKMNDKPLDAGLKTVMALRPVSYDLKPEYNPAGLGRQVGLIAEEVREVDDRLIAYDDDGQPRGVRYMQLTAVLIHAIQEQQREIDALKRRLGEQE
jgi:hypothetical protein